MSQTFADLGISKPVVRALEARGITAPFPIQHRVIRDVLAGRDVLVQSPTGSGKTLAFGAPLIDRLEPGGKKPSALVLAPTRELASQIVDELESLASVRKLRIAAVYGGVGFGPQIRAAQRADIIVATPGRLQDLLERGALKLDRVRVLVLDEADRMLDMGFRPAVDRIVALTPTQAADALLLRDPGGADREARRRLHPRRAQPRRGGSGSPEGRHLPSVPARRFPEREARSSGRAAACRQTQPHAGLRAHQARRRPAGQATAKPRHPCRRDARRQVTGPARARPRPL